MTDLTADDAALVTRLRQGVAAAARELYERHGSALLRFGIAMTHSRQTAEDVVHDTFVELLRHPSRFDPARGSVLAFLFGIARHRMARIARVSLRDALEAVGSELDIDDSNNAADGQPLLSTAPDTSLVTSSTEDAADALDRLQSIQHVRAAVFDLPRVHREVIILCDLEELPYASVAAILGCPIGTVRSRLSRARALLAARLDIRDDPDEAQPRPAEAENTVGRDERAHDGALDVGDSALTLSCRGSVT